MRSRLDEGSERRGKDKTRVRRKSKSPKGGKALQRLLNYLSERDPLLVADVVDGEQHTSTFACVARPTLPFDQSPVGRLLNKI